MSSGRRCKRCDRSLDCRAGMCCSIQLRATQKLAALEPVPAAGNGNDQPLLAAQEAELAMLDHEIERISGGEV